MVACSVESCDRVATRRGWCEGHYARWLTKGDVQADKPLKVIKRKAVAQRDQPCKVPGCESKRVAGGLCNAHYKRYKSGDINPDKPVRVFGRPVMERIAEKTTPGDNGCLLWTGSVDTAGYGQMHVNGKMRLVHRLVLEAAEGESDLFVDHVCGNPRCVAAEHLRYVTRGQNNAHRVKPPRAKAGYRGVHIQASGRFQALVRYQGKLLGLGTYDTAEEAAEVARAKRIELWGEEFENPKAYRKA